MSTATVPFTIQLPQPEVAFLETYAARHHITIADMIDYFIEQLHLIERYELHPEVAQNEYYDDLETKHS